ncbi:hypothetical protein C8R43DRAFT_1024660 [Mycena crocata]|nr:hypothetical protein C8R43DRAFT_1024660 [Mycena crocata]
MCLHCTRPRLGCFSARNACIPWWRRCIQCLGFLCLSKPSRLHLFFFHFFHYLLSLTAMQGLSLNLVCVLIDNYQSAYILDVDSTFVVPPRPPHLFNRGPYLCIFSWVGNLCIKLVHMGIHSWSVAGGISVLFDCIYVFLLSFVFTFLYCRVPVHGDFAAPRSDRRSARRGSGELRVFSKGVIATCSDSPYTDKCLIPGLFQQQ